MSNRRTKKDLSIFLWRPLGLRGPNGASLWLLVMICRHRDVSGEQKRRPKKGNWEVGKRKANSMHTYGMDVGDFFVGRKDPERKKNCNLY